MALLAQKKPSLLAEVVETFAFAVQAHCDAPAGP